MKDSLFNYQFEFEQKHYLYNSRINGLIELEEHDMEDSSVQEYLVTEGYIVEDEHNELKMFLEEVNQDIREDNFSLDLTISLTNTCNFKCVYCYQDKNVKYMSMDTAKEITFKVEKIINLIPYKEINIHYFGGEPLLNPKILFYFDSFFNELSYKYKINYCSYLTTNGSLLEKYISKINFTSIQLTFEGFEDIHNKMRAATFFNFDQQIKLIDKILDSQTSKLVIRMNACKNNQKDILSFYDYILRNFPSEKILFNLNRMIKFHSLDPFEMLSREEYALLELDLKILLKNHGHQISLPKQLVSNCKFIANNAFSLTVEGLVNQCSGTSKLDTQEFDEVLVKQKKELVLKEKCKQCFILPLCLGGCTVHHELGYNACAYDKKNFDKVLKAYLKQEIL